MEHPSHNYKQYQQPVKAMKAQKAVPPKAQHVYPQHHYHPNISLGATFVNQHQQQIYNAPKPEPHHYHPVPKATHYDPGMVAPVQRVVHPTRCVECHTVTRHPVCHVYPTHVRRIHHHIYEHYSTDPKTASDEVCREDVCCDPPKPMC